MKHETRQHPIRAPKRNPRETAPVTTDPLPADPDWHRTSQPVFVVEDSFYRARTPARPVHWSIAWSDLMLAMFILFLVLYAHQRHQQDILAHGIPNRIADEAIPVRSEEAPSALIFHPISQEVSQQTSPMLPEASPAPREQRGADILIRPQTVVDHRESSFPDLLPEHQPTVVATEPGVEDPLSSAAEDTVLFTESSGEEELITELFDLTQLSLSQNNLEQFASIELIPDKTVRIILTGDLLFPSGQADLTPDAVESLKQLAVIIKKTPYMVNVIGHTDDRPIRSARFPSNWELSVARASGVARFLIAETGLPAGQFSVTGYSSYRPVRPNINEENRRVNRRVEIILSKEPPAVGTTWPSSLQQPDDM
ncbi:OmpA family protein [Desulfobulbus alkaliphilus]|uniref:OmpA family protein n=1 Tax=Desulfobulbus alkaliphilus TaxID=869814 RepID=UPI001963BD7E|nr:OmpA family protein [Desulfobulbus alkaliphilus]MBM9536399.1 OmpA family protein [Desulfobulbus alkaliphilus]